MHKRTFWIAGLTAIGVLGGCGGGDNTNGLGPNGATPIDAACQADQIAALPVEALSADEASAIAFMREEEKLARDVYLALYDVWGLAIFANISDSEQTHTDAVLQLIERYSLPDPSAGKASGEFSDSRFVDLYAQLTTQGQTSQMEALTVGALIEDLDIFDLQNQLDAVVDNQDIAAVWENLQKGSRNHLRSFVSTLEKQGASYTPQYISSDLYEDIISSDLETGGC